MEQYIPSDIIDKWFNQDSNSKSTCDFVINMLHSFDKTRKIVSFHNLLFQTCSKVQLEKFHYINIQSCINCVYGDIITRLSFHQVIQIWKLFLEQSLENVFILNLFATFLAHIKIDSQTIPLSLIPDCEKCFNLTKSFLNTLDINFDSKNFNKLLMILHNFGQLLILKFCYMGFDINCNKPIKGLDISLIYDIPLDIWSQIVFSLENNDSIQLVYNIMIQKIIILSVSYEKHSDYQIKQNLVATVYSLVDLLEKNPNSVLVVNLSKLIPLVSRKLMPRLTNAIVTCYKSIDASKILSSSLETETDDNILTFSLIQSIINELTLRFDGLLQKICLQLSDILEIWQENEVYEMHLNEISNKAFREIASKIFQLEIIFIKSKKILSILQIFAILPLGYLNSISQLCCSFFLISLLFSLENDSKLVPVCLKHLNRIFCGVRSVWCTDFIDIFQLISRLSRFGQQYEDIIGSMLRYSFRSRCISINYLELTTEGWIQPYSRLIYLKEINKINKKAFNESATQICKWLLDNIDILKKQNERRYLEYMLLILENQMKNKDKILMDENYEVIWRELESNCISGLHGDNSDLYYQLAGFLLIWKGIEFSFRENIWNSIFPSFLKKFIRKKRYIDGNEKYNDIQINYNLDYMISKINKIKKVKFFRKGKTYNATSEIPISFIRNFFQVIEITKFKIYLDYLNDEMGSSSFKKVNKIISIWKGLFSYNLHVDWKQSEEDRGELLSKYINLLLFNCNLLIQKFERILLEINIKQFDLIEIDIENKKKYINSESCNDGKNLHLRNEFSYEEIKENEMNDFIARKEFFKYIESSLISIMELIKLILKSSRHFITSQHIHLILQILSSVPLNTLIFHECFPLLYMALQGVLHEMLSNYHLLVNFSTHALVGIIVHFLKCLLNSSDQQILRFRDNEYIKKMEKCGNSTGRLLGFYTETWKNEKIKEIDYMSIIACWINCNETITVLDGVKKGVLYGLYKLIGVLEDREIIFMRCSESGKGLFRDLCENYDKYFLNKSL